MQCPMSKGGKQPRNLIQVAILQVQPFPDCSRVLFHQCWVLALLQAWEPSWQGRPPRLDSKSPLLHWERRTQALHGNFHPQSSGTHRMQVTPRAPGHDQNFLCPQHSLGTSQLQPKAGQGMVAGGGQRGGKGLVSAPAVSPASLSAFCSAAANETITMLTGVFF